MSDLANYCKLCERTVSDEDWHSHLEISTVHLGDGCGFTNYRCPDARQWSWDRSTFQNPHGHGLPTHWEAPESAAMTEASGGMAIELRVMCGDIEVGRGDLDVPILTKASDEPGQIRVAPDMSGFKKRLADWFRAAADETENLT